MTHAPLSTDDLRARIADVLPGVRRTADLFPFDDPAAPAQPET